MQYHSIDAQTGVQEFCCGPASDVHATGIPKSWEKRYLFHRVAGGFLSVSVTPLGRGSEITFKHHDVFGKTVYRFKKRSPL